MIHSMTGYGKSEFNGKNHHYTIELRSLNSKTFDVNFRIPSLLRPYESMMRKLLQETLVRGKVDVNIAVVSRQTSLDQVVDVSKLEAYLSFYHELLEKSGASGDPLAAAMRMPDVLSGTDGSLSDDDVEELLGVLRNALRHIESFRAEEGSAMERDLRSAVLRIDQLLTDVSQFEEERMTRIRQKFEQHFSELHADVNRDRLEQEMIYYIEKLDINEEKVRLKQHILYFIDVMEASMHSGRKLNFIAQEMGREINTLGSKCQHESIQKLVVDMKDTLEQMKEINLNIA